MSRMIFDLTDEDRLALEAHRIRLGLRSHAETLRSLIRDEGGDVASPRPAEGLRALEAWTPRQVRVTPDEALPRVPLKLPQSKPGSRLKKR